MSPYRILALEKSEENESRDKRVTKNTDTSLTIEVYSVDISMSLAPWASKGSMLKRTQEAIAHNLRGELQGSG